MRHLLRSLGFFILNLLIVGLIMVGGIVLDRQVLIAFVPPSTIPADARADFRLMAEAWNIIERFYVDRTALKPRRLTYGALSGMVDALGDTGHSHFLSPDMVQQTHTFAEGRFEGIGAELQMQDRHAVIVAPMDGSPAQQAGLQPGDIILKVNAAYVTGLPLEQIVQHILGPAGTAVTLTILDPSTQRTREVTLVRARIALHNVTWHTLPGTMVAHVRLAAFSKGITDDLQQVLTEMRQQGLRRVILDLRSNPGGLLAEAVGTASQFLRSGNVLLVRDARGHTTPIPVQSTERGLSLPMVVLINKGTASAAEIVAGALQDAHRAALVGETTFGTGTVLREFDLSDGSALLLAIEEWLTPSGRVFWHRGITPDVEVALPPNVTLLLPEAERQMTPVQLQAAADTQLLRALDLVTRAGDTQAP
jgi:carboxyl-terminal processing protease